MEYILITLFGGGELDWQDIGKTYYDWKDIFDYVIYEGGKTIEECEINDLYWAILELALQDLSDKMQDKMQERSEDFKYCSNNIDKFFEIYANCLDTHLTFIGREELGKEIQEVMADEIEEINNKIGFTRIEF